MSYPVTYYCPHCGTFLALERDGYLADKAVTPYPFEGWAYVEPTEPFDGDADGGDATVGDIDPSDADGVRFVCGESDGVEWNPDRATQSPPDELTQPTADSSATTTGDGQSSDGQSSDGQPDDGQPDDDRLGCGELFYLSFVRYEDGREIDPRPEPELVEIDPDPRSSGPRGPSGPDGSGGSGGFW